MISNPIQLGDRLNDYLDGRLSDRERADFLRHLAGDPDAQRYVTALERQDRALRRLGAPVLAEPVPEHLTTVIRQRSARAAHGARSQRRLVSIGALAASAFGIFLCGGIGGWSLHQYLNPIPAPIEGVLRAAGDAFDYYSSDDAFPLAFASDESEKLQALILKQFGREIAYPDLSAAGYAFAGGNILPGIGRRTAFFLYDGSDGRQVSIFAWPTEGQRTDAPALAELEHAAARYWFADGLGFIVLGTPAIDGLDELVTSIFDFYGETPVEG